MAVPGAECAHDRAFVAHRIEVRVAHRVAQAALFLGHFGGIQAAVVEEHWLCRRAHRLGSNGSQVTVTLAGDWESVSLCPELPLVPYIRCTVACHQYRSHSCRLLIHLGTPAGSLFPSAYFAAVEMLNGIQFGGRQVEFTQAAWVARLMAQRVDTSRVRSHTTHRQFDRVAIVRRSIVERSGFHPSYTRAIAAISWRVAVARVVGIHRYRRRLVAGCCRRN